LKVRVVLLAVILRFFGRIKGHLETLVLAKEPFRNEKPKRRALRMFPRIVTSLKDDVLATGLGFVMVHGPLPP
jgi:hypothetical protein